MVIVVTRVLTVCADGFHSQNNEFVYIFLIFCQ